MRIALGPVSYSWPRESVMAFYERMLAQPLDVLYVGETVCSKRRELRVADWFELARGIAASGRQAVLSTLTLIEAGSELNAVRQLCDNGEFLVEANDLAAVRLLSERRMPFVAGPGINIYSAATLARLVKLGLQRWVVPSEMSRSLLADLIEAARARELAVQTEVFGYGRLPLAYSARCFTARYYNLPKDDCQLRCRDHPDGIAIRTQEGSDFLTLNGIQTQSGRVYSLIDEWTDLRALGVSTFRVSPQLDGSTEAAIAALRQRLDGSTPTQPVPAATCNGYWHGQPGMLRLAG
ncbi:MAG TPA: U32 family peptidase [Burkholderiaceae bacterium]|jgi:O2-independent ubiquinone biosynthesis protein UbiV|nr:U32 family peptidase [Burkholderiaceae bacterium]